MSKGKDKAVVQDAFIFPNEAKKLMKETEVIYNSTDEILQFSQDNLCKRCCCIWFIKKKCDVSGQ